MKHAHLVNVLKANTAADRQGKELTATCIIQHHGQRPPECVRFQSSAAEWALINQPRPTGTGSPTPATPRRLWLLSIAEQQSNNSHFIYRPPFGTGNEVLYNDKKKAAQNKHGGLIGNLLKVDWGTGGCRHKSRMKCTKAQRIMRSVSEPSER